MDDARETRDRREGADRRRHVRFDGAMAPMRFIRYHSLPSGEPDVYHVGKLVDVSKGGMCFTTDHAVRKGEKIEYQVISPIGKREQQGTARVVRVMGESDQLFVAVEFIA